MIKEILSAAGIPNEPGRFPDPPPLFAVYFDDVDTLGGPDPFPDAPQLRTHNAMVELYEPDHNDDAEAAVEAELDARGIPWTKQAAYWLQNVQRYQVVYEFTYKEKRRT
jgi:hypothetical protein